MSSPDGEVKNRTSQPAIVITGASSGIGREMALIAAREAPVALVARSRDRLAELAAEIIGAGGAAHVLPLDLAREGAASDIMQFLDNRDLYCDVLVNNAGYGLVGPADQLDRADQLGLIALNVRAMTDLSLTMLPGMMARRRGGIIHVGSVASFLPGPYMATYYASKAFVRSFSEALWEECRRAGVVITALCPGPVETGFFERATGHTAKPRLFQLLPNDDARAVAQKGWRGFRGKRRMVVPGAINKIVVYGARFVPTFIVLWAVRKLQKRRSQSTSSGKADA